MLTMVMGSLESSPTKNKLSPNLMTPDSSLPIKTRPRPVILKTSLTTNCTVSNNAPAFAERPN